MILKATALLLFIVAAYCQDHYGNTFTLQTLVSHNLPHTVEFNDQGGIERQLNTDSSQTVKAQTTLGNGQEIYNEDPIRKFILSKEPAPVYEFEPVRAPVELKIVKQTVPHASTHHRVVQLVQQSSIKPQVIRVAPVAPVIHQAPSTPVVQQTGTVPVQYSPIQHHNVLVPDHKTLENHYIQVANQAPVHESITDTANVPEYHEKVLQTELNHKESYYDDLKEQHDHNLDYYAYPKYEFSYEVKDLHTHDVKYQHESRDGDVVKGVYSLQEPDGSTRIVNYTSNKKEGFNAEVLHKSHTKHN